MDDLVQLAASRRDRVYAVCRIFFFCLVAARERV
jgi:hypothetical protein